MTSDPEDAAGSGTEAPPPGQVDVVKTRATVLRAAVRLIAEHGIDGMTMRQVARASGLSTGTINYHFSNKRGLVLAAIDAAPPAPAGEVGYDPLAALQGLLRGFVLEDDERRDWWRFWVEVTAQATRDTDLRERQRLRTMRQAQTLEELLAEGVARGHLRPEVEPALVGEPLLALAHGLAVHQLLSPDAATVRRASDALEGSLRELSVR